MEVKVNHEEEDEEIYTCDNNIFIKQQNIDITFYLLRSKN